MMGSGLQNRPEWFSGESRRCWCIVGRGASRLSKGNFKKPWRWCVLALVLACLFFTGPASAYSSEPEPNSGCINMSACSDTVYTSKSVGEELPPPEDEAEQLVITTSSPLSAGAVGYQYQNIQAKLEVSGGSPPYTWEIVQGSLPGGLTLDSESGQVYGTPTAAGDFVFTASVTDGVSSVSKEFEISIIEAGLPDQLWIDFVDGGIEPPTAVLPLDKGIKHRFKVKNPTAKHLILEIAAATTTGERVMIMNPQPQVLYLEPGEEQWVTAILEPGAAEVGTHTVTINYTFINSFDKSEKKIYSCEYQYQVLAVEPYEAADFTGDFVVSGTVEDESGRPVTGALVELAYQAGAMHGENTPLVAETSMDGNFSFSARRHPNWYLRVSKEGYKDAYAFDLTREPLTITLQPFSREVPQYERVKQVQTVAGFWKYIVDENEEVILLANGMENWQDPGLKDQSKLVLYTLDGDLLWEYAAGCETWGADLSRDGKWAACVTNGKPRPGPHDYEGNLTLLDAETGEVVWQKEVVEENFPRAAGLGVLPHSLEVQFSHDAGYLGIGMVNGDFHLLNRAGGSVIWSRFTEGQVRRVLFSPDDQHVYVGSGAGRLYKFKTADGTLLWQTRIWSWPYTYGLDLSPDGTLIAAGTKSGEVSVIKTSDGTKLWDYDMGIMCTRWVQFSPDGELLAAGSGAPCGTTVFDADTGEVLWRTGFSAAGMFTAGGEYLFIGEGTGKLFTRDGTLVTGALDPGFTGTAGGYWKTAYISSDRSRVVLAARDMEPNTAGIAFFRAVTGEDITPPTVPSNLQVTGRTSSTITITWDASDDAGGIAEYIVEMKQAGGEFVEVGTTTTTSFQKTGLASSTAYIFRVRAKDNADNVSGWSGEIRAATKERSGMPGDGDYYEWEPGTINDPYKEWTIRFSRPLDPGTVNDDNIYVVENDTGRRIGIRLNYDDNGKSVVVSPPSGGYEPGSYTLYIEKNLCSARGRQLKKAVKMEFTVTAEHEPVTGKTAVLTRGEFGFSTGEFYGFDDDSPEN